MVVVPRSRDASCGELLAVHAYNRKKLIDPNRLELSIRILINQAG